MTSKGQVTIPKALRQQLGLARGSRLSFQLVDDHIEVRPCRPSPAVGTSGFGLLKSERPPIPVDFDPASLLRCGIGTGMGVAGLLRFSDKAGAAGA